MYFVFVLVYIFKIIRDINIILMFSRTKKLLICSKYNLNNFNKKELIQRNWVYIILFVWIINTNKKKKIDKTLNWKICF